VDRDQREFKGEPPDEIDDETAVVMPRREAMSVISPPFVSGILKATDNPPADTDQGIDETDPSGSA